VSQQHSGKQGSNTLYPIHIPQLAGHTAQCLHITAFGGIEYIAHHRVADGCPIAQSTAGKFKSSKQEKIYTKKEKKTEPERLRAPTENKKRKKKESAKKHEIAEET
jgi:hypothetical protein